jgi:drug/metabolite transporter (DMT)-like permease
MQIPYAGEIASIITSMLFSIGPTFFTLGGMKVGSVVVNRVRLLLALLLLIIVHWFLYGLALPFDAEPYRWGWLALSGVIGLALGDAALFQAFIMIGTRLTMLIFALSPVISTIFAWVFLEENLSTEQIIGIVVTLAGVVLVVSERRRKRSVESGAEAEEAAREYQRYGVGLFLAFLGATGQALGLVTAKLGLGVDFPVLSGQVIRMLGGGVLVWVITIIQGKVGYTFASLRQEPLALRDILFGVLAGPFAGIWFSLIGIQLTSVGVASTLQALPPIFLLPIGYIVFKERYGWRAIIGTAVTLAGVAVLFLI